MTVVRHGLLICAALLLSACSAFQAPPPVPQEVTENWQQYQQRMQQQRHWQLEGKVGIRTANENNSAGFQWLQQAERFDIQLSGPFNAQAARIYGDDLRTTLESDGQRFSAQSPEILLQRQLGWQLPVRELVWWVRGLPAPGSPAQQQLQNERLSKLQQQGWQISYDRYSPDLSHPEKLTLLYDQLRIRLIIHQWKNFSDK